MSTSRQNAGNILLRQECRKYAGVMEDEKRREGVGVLKEECHLSLRPHFRICHVLSEYLCRAKGGIRLEMLILELSSR